MVKSEDHGDRGLNEKTDLRSQNECFEFVSFTGGVKLGTVFGVRAWEGRGG